MQPTNPAAFRFLKTAGRHQHVEVGIEIQKSTEGLGHHDQKHANTVFVLHPALYSGGSDCGQIIQQMAILLKDWPENAGHRKVDAHIGDVWEYGFQFLLPQSRRSISTARTSSRLAGVINEQPLNFGGIDFCAQSKSSTIDDFQEIVTDG